jgi:hypothetical protein
MTYIYFNVFQRYVYKYITQNTFQNFTFEEHV